jgi:hypothetical protein
MSALTPPIRRVNPYSQESIILCRQTIGSRCGHPHRPQQVLHEWNRRSPDPPCRGFFLQVSCDSRVLQVMKPLFPGSYHRF